MNREKWQIVKLIRRVMEERSPVFNCQVQSVVDIRGQAFAIDILVKTLRVEMNGGMMIADGSRRRTRGGTYIKLVKDELSYEQKRELRLLTKEKMKAHAEWTKAHREAEALARQAALEASAVEPEIEETVIPPAPEVVANRPEAPKQKNGKAAKPAANKKHDFAASRQARFQTAATDSPDMGGDLPPAVKGKLEQLQAAANVLRERVQQLEAKPVGQQVGLEMARKLLASNEAQIAALLAEHERSGEVVSP